MFTVLLLQSLNAKERGKMLIRTGVGFGANTIAIVQILIFTAF